MDTQPPEHSFNPFACREQTQKDINDLRSEVRDMRSVIIGIDGNNGLRSKINLMAERQETLTTTFEAYVHSQQLKEAGNQGKWDMAAIGGKVIWLTFGVIALAGASKFVEIIIEKLAS